MQLQGMHPDMPQGPHMPPQMPPRSMPLSRGHTQWHLPAWEYQWGPYGPSGPLPPNMGGQIMPVPMRPNMPPAGQKMPSPLNNVQLQQLSAQIKAYRMLSRSMAPPEALISIVHGRKPTPAMLGSLGRGTPSAQQTGMGFPLSGGVPSPAGSSQSAHS